MPEVVFSGGCGCIIQKSIQCRSMPGPYAVGPDVMDQADQFGRGQPDEDAARAAAAALAAAAGAAAERAAGAADAEEAAGAVEDWVPEGGGSLKQLIEEYAEIEASRMRLFYRQIPLSNDQLTLRSYGIKDGDTISLRIQRFVPGCSMGRDVQLATSKRLEPSAEERSGASKYDGYSLRFCKRLKEFRNANGDVYMQPKWCSEMNPRLFAKVGVAVDGAGNFSAAPNQLDAPIWIRDKDNEKLRRVRLAVAGRM
ncbi:unnamed protein product [Prorocentrum cordatum]|uniref:Ubiquitin-like domain-containing protein n=1 Tax=Prorocentrum cordatum TaxID=2364126 RepID=A0ABN9W7C1_9DINO|nr:unnamed protein product [Polarella glacialis]